MEDQLELAQILRKPEFRSWCREMKVHFIRIFRCTYCMIEFRSPAMKAVNCIHAACPQCTFRDSKFCVVCTGQTNFFGPLVMHCRTKDLLSRMVQCGVLTHIEREFLFSNMCTLNAVLDYYTPCFACHKPCNSREYGNLTMCLTCTVCFDLPEVALSR
jgi:hypothetical protein